MTNRAVAATELPHDFTLDDLHWPLPGMVVGFPPAFMRIYLGRDVCYVYAANCDAGDYHVAALPGCPIVTIPGVKLFDKICQAGVPNLGVAADAGACSKKERPRALRAPVNGWSSISFTARRRGRAFLAAFLKTVWPCRGPVSRGLGSRGSWKARPGSA
jgi:hypothetical protein